MPQNTNLNSSPYFDDFEELKNYQRVLFKPGLPVQSRELTTLQSILQNQIEKFGKHFFKEGSVVIPGQIAYDSDYTAVQIDDSHLGIPVSLYLENLVGKKIKGETSGVTAKVENYITNRESGKGAYTLYIKYQSSSDTDFSRVIFADGENLLLEEDLNYSLSSIRSGASFATTIISNSTATGAAAKIAGFGVFQVMEGVTKVFGTNPDSKGIGKVFDKLFGVLQIFGGLGSLWAASRILMPWKLVGDYKKMKKLGDTLGKIKKFFQRKPNVPKVTQGKGGKVKGKPKAKITGSKVGIVDRAKQFGKKKLSQVKNTKK